MLADILGKNRLRRLGFYIPVGRIIAQQAVMLNKAKEELPLIIIANAQINKIS